MSNDKPKLGVGIVPGADIDGIDASIGVEPPGVRGAVAEAVLLPARPAAGLPSA
jgi:hypothetical protein